MRTPFDTFIEAKEGVSVERVRAVTEALGITLKELAGLLGIAESTLHRKLKAQEPITERAAAEQLIELESLAEHGNRVFSKPSRFIEWIRQPQWDLNDEIPFDYLTSVSGVRVVDTIISRIEYNLPI